MSQSSWYQLDWIWQTTGWSLAAIGCLLLLWSLFYDRAKGRRRCPKCWYDMAGIPPAAAPSAAANTSTNANSSKPVATGESRASR